MSLELPTTPLHVSLLGASTTHDPSKRYGDEIRSLLDKVWGPIRTHSIAHKGINWVIYSPDNHIFAGVEAAAPTPAPGPAALGLEQHDLHLDRYAAWRHVGPYDRIPQSNAAMKDAIKAQGLEHRLPMIERYGHWSDDPAQLITDLFWSLR